MALAVEEFLARLHESGLATQDEIKSWLDAIPEAEQPQTGDGLAQKLVAHRALTEFQSQSLLEAGEHPLVLGKYILLEHIGQGGTGTVYKALHRHMRRDVAIKLLHAELATSPESLRRFQREILAGGTLNHPHIIPTLDAAQQDDTSYLVMEYFPGTDLATLVNNRGRLPVEQAIKIALQAAQGLGHAHEKGIIHRDVKPSNLLCDADLNVRILDLGLARFTHADGQSELTGTGDMMGTVDYMAPEQAVSTRQADARADIYSLGCTLFFLLMGRPPFEGETVMSRLLAHRDTSIPSLRSLRKDVPDALDTIVRKMLAKQPADRYQTMREVVTALAPFERPPRTWSRWLTRRNGLLTAVGILLATVVLFAPRLRLTPVASDDTASPKALGAAEPAPAAAIAPFDAQQAIAVQESWAKHVGVPVEIENTIGMKLRLIPPGEFTQGASAEEIAEAISATSRAYDADSPPHHVRLTRPFYLGVFEVTQAEFESVVGRNPSQHCEAGVRGATVAGLDTRRFPVEMVSWFDAVDFCNALSARESRRPCYQRTAEEVVRLPGDGYRLPTEAEWEFMCRAGTTAPWSCNSAIEVIEQHGWFSTNSGGRAQAVGLLQPNPFQLFDVHGNVWEWCEDLFDPRDYAALAGQTLENPTGPTVGTARTMRGGVWNDHYWSARSSHRGAHIPTTQNESIGFRVVLTIP